MICYLICTMYIDNEKMIGITMFNYNVTIVLCILIKLISLTSGFLFGPKKNGTVTTFSSTVISTVSSTVKTTPKDEDLDILKAEAGTIAGAVFGVLIGTVFISVVGILYIRRKRARDRAYIRNATVHRMSKQSAGVYTDTTVDSNLPPDELDLEDRRFLPRNTNIYHDDSEDELWSANVR